ncbi:Crp/Fnr family transcriptional regulator [Robiginitalea marina]|uniref:Crp/Fnr family transcriptional regulator n=1 Tax=Robiginitalea marina TaxID=2954105 RepID=A0ABT1B146_9FLAO|nr:Crp/Fnr family transcriptional regulator [Robiginitalea marina]MCO5725906.1 Crp/Fnr family transcriptional regulator [Robiginitalea marina]
MKDLLSSLPAALGRELMDRCERRSFPAKVELLREGQYVQAIPIVLKGLIKVCTRYEDRELLLYYIEPEESCIMSFWAGFSEEPSRVFALTEEDSELLMVPAAGLQGWLREYPAFGSLFFQQYAKRYSELLDTIHHILFSQLDVRLYQHLLKKARLHKSGLISMSHQQLADELGTVREVISRTLKKLELEGMVKQSGHRIELLKM